MASQAVIESVLRPYGVGPSQWFVLYRLALVRKGYAEQVPDPDDQRQKTLQLTAEGARLWDRLPDPIAHTLAVAFHGVDQRDQDAVVQILREATGRLTQHLTKGTPRS